MVVLLWLLAVVVQLGITVLVFDGVHASILTEVAQRFPGDTQATKDKVVLSALGVSLGSGVLIALLQLVCAYRVRNRWVLLVLGLFGAVHGVMVFGAWSALLIGVLVAAVAAMFLPAARAWYVGGRS